MLVPHLRVSPRDVSPRVLLPGDPARVLKIKKYLDDARKVGDNRGYVTYTGSYKSKSVTVMNSGMGGPSLAIAVHELEMCGAKTIIRVGSCGALQEDMSLGSLVVPSQCVREEGTTNMYVEKDYPALPDKKIYEELVRNCKKHKFKYSTGTTRSHDSFYTPRNKQLEDFWSKAGVLASDFETAPLFVIGKLLKIKTGSILNVVDLYSRRKSQESIKAFQESLRKGEKAIKNGEKNSIIAALETIKKF
jgi:uridine phosphorylase